MPLNAIITAGGHVPRCLSGVTSLSRKALIEVNGRTLLDTAITAVNDCRRIDGLVVVGNSEVAAALPGRVAFLPEGESLVENVQRAFNHLGEDSCDYVTISPDLPFLTGADLDEFLAAALPSCEIGVPLVERDDFLKSYPGAPNKFGTIAGGRQVTTGSCFYLQGPTLKANFPLFHDMFRFRKHPHRLAIMLGLPILLAFAFGRLRIEMAEGRLSQLTGAEVKVVSTAMAGIAYDIDDLQNYEFALELIQRQES